MGDRLSSILAVCMEEHLLEMSTLKWFINKFKIAPISALSHWLKKLKNKNYLLENNF